MQLEFHFLMNSIQLECIRTAITFYDMEHQNNYINTDLNKSTCCTLQLNCESSVILGFNAHYFSFTLIRAKLIWCLVFDDVYFYFILFFKKIDIKYKVGSALDFKLFLNIWSDQGFLCIFYSTLPHYIVHTKI